MLISTYKNAVATWLHKRIVDPLLQILRRGAEPKQLAFSTALGMTLGIFPICGVTVFLCGMAIALLGSLCHAPSMMLANFIATPIELSLVVPFLRFGEVIIGGPHFPLTSDALRKVLTGQASRDVLQSIVNADLKTGNTIGGGHENGGLYYFTPCRLLQLPPYTLLSHRWIITAVLGIPPFRISNWWYLHVVNWSHCLVKPVIVRVACCGTLYLGHTLHNILAVFQALGSKVQHRSFKPE